MLNLDAKKIEQLQKLAGSLADRAARENLPALLRDLEQQLRIDPAAGTMDLDLRIRVELSGCGAWSFSSDATWAIRNRRRGVGDVSGCDFGQPTLPGLDPDAESAKAQTAEKAADYGRPGPFLQRLELLHLASGMSRPEFIQFINQVAYYRNLPCWNNIKVPEDYEALLLGIEEDLRKKVAGEGETAAAALPPQPVELPKATREALAKLENECRELQGLPPAPEFAPAAAAAARSEAEAELQRIAARSRRRAREEAE